MQDSSYTNKLVKLRDGQAVIAKRIASIKAEIANLGKDAATKAEYSNLTNMLAKCESEARLMQKATQQAVRERLLKNLKEKGDLKK
jgi:acetyl-CoA carboxylase carboxyltransferase component